MRISKMMLFVALATYSSGQANQVKVKTDQTDFTFIGERLDIKTSNTLIGNIAGQKVNGGMENTIIGSDAGSNLEIGNGNTIIGNKAGLNGLGSGNVLIGNKAGMNEMGEEKLYISNSETTTPLIYGDFRARKLTVNDDLVVTKKLTVKDNAYIEGNAFVDLDVNARRHVISSEIPQLMFNTTFPGLTDFYINYNPTQDLVYMAKVNATENELELRNGELTLPAYAGSGTANLSVDATGKVIKTSAYAAVQQVFNRFEFTQEDVYTDYRRVRKGVQFPDGAAISTLKAWMLDNDLASSNGVHDTAFAGLYRISRKNETNDFEVIFRVDGSNTPVGAYSEFTSSSPIAGRNVIDNENWIYVFQLFYCNDDCGVNEVSVVLE